MRNDMIFTIIGGDLRQMVLAKKLASDGFFVNAIALGNDAFGHNITVFNDIDESLKNSDCVILPLPASFDNETINAPFTDDKIYLVDIFKAMNKNQLLFGGKISDKMLSMMQLYGVHPNDYFKREEMAILNAIPTAEGAIEIAMAEMPITLHSSECIVIGFGRIGKILAKMLSALGANVSVVARHFDDLAWIKAYGYKAIHISELINTINKYDAIFNTAPAIVLEKSLLKKINSNSLVIDLASKPGGVDFETAKELGVKVIWALSLPGKVAPVTAANIIKDTILNIIKELGV